MFRLSLHLGALHLDVALGTEPEEYEDEEYDEEDEEVYPGEDNPEVPVEYPISFDKDAYPANRLACPRSREVFTAVSIEVVDEEDDL